MGFFTPFHVAMNLVWIVLKLQLNLFQLSGGAYTVSCVYLEGAGQGGELFDYSGTTASASWGASDSLQIIDLDLFLLEPIEGIFLTYFESALSDRIHVVTLKIDYVPRVAD